MQIEFPSGAKMPWPNLSQERGYTITTDPTREDWLKARANDVTASAAGALVGVHDYQTALGLWSLKSGKTSEDPEESGPMRRGRLLEPVALQMLREDRPAWQCFGGVNHYWRDPSRRIGATPDCYVIDEQGRFCVVQFKTVEPSIFVRKWQGGDRYGVIEPPLWIVIQAILEAELTGAEKAYVAALVIGFGIELHIIEVPMHHGILEKIRGEVAAFWQLIERNEMPPPNYGKDADLIAKLFPIREGLVLDLKDDNELPALAIEDEEQAAIAKAAETRRKEIKAEVRHKLGIEAGKLVGDGKPGEATIAMYQGGIITAKNIFRKSYTTSDTTYLDVRFKEGRDLSDATKAKATKPKRGAAPKTIEAEGEEIF